MSDEPNLIITRSGRHLARYSARRPNSIVVCCTTCRMARAGTVVRITRRAVLYAVLAIIAQPGRVIGRDELFEAGYGDDPEGGPLSICSTVIVPDMKVAAAAIGFRVERHGNMGWSAHDMLPATRTAA